MQKPSWHLMFFLLLAGSIGFPFFAQQATSTQLYYKGYVAENDTVSVDYVIHNDSLFKTKTQFPSQSNQKDAYWLQVDFAPYVNSLQNDSVYILRALKFYEARYYYKVQDQLVHNDFGFFNAQGSSDTKSVKGIIYFKKENLIKNRWLYLKIKRYTPNYDLNNLKITYQTERAYNFETTYYSREELIKATPVYLFLGASGFIILFALITYYSSRKLDFLFYALYVFSLILYLTKSAFGFQEYINNHYSLIAIWTHSFIQILINLFYVIFAKYYLETKNSYPKLDKAIRFIIPFLIGLLIVQSTSIFLLQFEAHHFIMNMHRLVMSVFAFASFIYLFIYAKNKLAYFIIIGSLAFTTGSLGMLFTSDKNYMILGAVVEAFLFGMGLSYKMKLNSREKKILRQSAFDDRISALRAQINPHFIFNSLSSIQHLVTSNDRVATLKYLSKFSRLTRNILESSIETNVVLRDEIKMLKDYLELESLRFDNSFSYEINLEENVDADSLEIPFMILQPFVENAIIHGLLPKKDGKKELRITFHNQGNFMVCEIDDNGVGRKVATEREHIHRRKKKSRGLQVTKQRLEAFGEEANVIEIIDKTDGIGNSLGTTIRIKIPL